MLRFKRSSSTEPSVLQLNFDIQPCHVRLQSDDLSAPHVVRDGSSPSFLLTYSQNQSPGIPLWHPFSVIPSPDRAACIHDSDLDLFHLTQLSALLPQHDSLLPPPPPSSSSCQASPRLTSSILAPAAHSCLSSACSFSLLIFVSQTDNPTPQAWTSSSTPVIPQSSLLHAYLPWILSSAPFISLNFSEVRLQLGHVRFLFSALPAHSPLLGPGVHLTNARPCLSLGEMLYSISFFIPFLNLQLHFRHSGFLTSLFCPGRFHATTHSNIPPRLHS
ncbi:hypothetical protein ILYODFUR_008720 [Ilyodon furcidens]|uniref:Uncharacterized protein n=1 Tax=Ilyodon furcidens TaxID=33524 RepID=A0ABV0SLV2_9TELE